MEICDDCPFVEGIGNIQCPEDNGYICPKKAMENGFFLKAKAN